MIYFTILKSRKLIVYHLLLIFCYFSTLICSAQLKQKLDNNAVIANYGIVYNFVYGDIQLPDSIPFTPSSRPDLSRFSYYNTFSNQFSLGFKQYFLGDLFLQAEINYFERKYALILNKDTALYYYGESAKYKDLSNSLSINIPLSIGYRFQNNLEFSIGGKLKLFTWEKNKRYYINDEKNEMVVFRGFHSGEIDPPYYLFFSAHKNFNIKGNFLFGGFLQVNCRNQFQYEEPKWIDFSIGIEMNLLNKKPLLSE